MRIRENNIMLSFRLSTRYAFNLCTYIILTTVCKRMTVDFCLLLLYVLVQYWSYFVAYRMQELEDYILSPTECRSQRIIFCRLQNVGVKRIIFCRLQNVGVRGLYLVSYRMQELEDYMLSPTECKSQRIIFCRLQNVRVRGLYFVAYRM